ncbi:RNA-directed DNA polymerase, eukaryota, reverse transcriptase zinc-binding domain protein [Tanacetum coccineum]
MFTWMNKSGSKLSKLDRFLISNNVLLALSSLQVTVLDRVWSDHNPILLHCQKNDFGPTPFKVYHSWFERCDFDNVVKETWNSFAANDDGPFLPLHAKIKGLKLHLKTWASQTKDNEANRKKSILALLKSLDEKIDAGQASDDDRMLRVNTWHELDNLEKLASMDLIQKARIRWDEGVWIFDPSAIKMAFLNFYKDKFSCHDSPVILPSMSSAKSLSDSDRHLLDYMVSLEEIKNAVWDCGSKKDPGPDGFSFLFVKKYWDIMKIDIQNFVVRFFSSCSFPPVMEGLHIALKDELTANVFQGIKIGSSEIRLSHLFYADDVIILSEWNQYDMDNIIRILNVFYLASGLKINISKSNLYGVGVSSNDIESMAAGTGCSASNLPFSYLGFPIGGRLTLIRSVLGSLGMDKSKNHKKTVKIEQARTRESEEYKSRKQSQESQASVKSSQSMVNKSQQSPSSFYNIHKG